MRELLLSIFCRRCRFEYREIGYLTYERIFVPCVRHAGH